MQENSIIVKIKTIFYFDKQRLCFHLGGHPCILAWWRYKKAFKKEWHSRSGRYDVYTVLILLVDALLKLWPLIFLKGESLSKSLSDRSSISSCSSKQFLCWWVSFMTSHGLVNIVIVMVHLFLLKYKYWNSY